MIWNCCVCMLQLCVLSDCTECVRSRRPFYLTCGPVNILNLISCIFHCISIVAQQADDSLFPPEPPHQSAKRAPILPEF